MSKTEELIENVVLCCHFRGCTSLTTAVLQNVAVIESGAFDGDIYLNCLISLHQYAVTKLLNASCTLSSTGFCAPLSGCPVQLNYSFLDNTVEGLMVANEANNFYSFDATLQNGATVIDDQLLLKSDYRQFTKIQDFFIGTTELTLSFWFRAFSINNGSFCQFYNNDDGFFRIVLNDRWIVFGTDAQSVKFSGFDVDQWNHVAFVQTNQNGAHSPAACTWSIFRNGKPEGSKLVICAMGGKNTLNYIGVSQNKSDSLGNYLNGSIRQFQLYNSALKLSDIKGLYSSTTPDFAPTLSPTSPTFVPTESSTSTFDTRTSAPILSVPIIVGIALAGFLAIATFAFIINLKFRPKHTYMSRLMHKKERQTSKYLDAKNYKLKSVTYSSVGDVHLAPLMKELEKLLVSGEEWRQKKHEDSTEHDEHCFVELWRSSLRNTETLMCTDCNPAKPVTPETMPEKYYFERARMEKDKDLYDFEPRNSVNRGIVVGFLVEFCRNFDLWAMPTWQVRRDYIIPITKDYRCRFVDLPVIKESGVVGAADIFISFSNATLFGDLITAIRDAANDDRRVWIDIFAVMQWPSLKSDLNFDEVIKRCPTFLSVCPSVAAVGKRKKISGVYELTKEDKKMIPFFRVWCLFEIYHAATVQKSQEVDRILVGDGDMHNILDLENSDVFEAPLPLTILFKTGKCQRSSDGSYSFQVDRKMLVDLIDYIDINNADATSEGDKEWIFDQIRTGFASNGGVAGLNKLVTDVVARAKILDSDFILEFAVCGGDAVALEFIRSQPELYIMNMYRCGFSSLLSKMMNVDESSMIRVSISNRLKDPVEVYTISYDGTSLNYEFTVEKRKTTKYSMAEGSFWIARELGDDSDVGVYIANKAMTKWIVY